VSLLVVGLSHHSAPVPVLERVSIPTGDVAKVLDELHRGESISEVMALSTCNRIEIYADVDRFHPAVVEISTVLARLGGMGVNELGEYLYVHFAEAAADHLLRVASGLDSMVIGESQILGQMRAAYAAGRDADTVGSVLHDASQTALRVGKRVHTETSIDRAGASVVSVALAQASRQISPTSDAAEAGAAHPLAGRRVVIVGAGSMGALTSASLQRLVGPGNLDAVIVNRSIDKAERLAATTGGRAAGLDRLVAEIRDADVLISSTGATGVVVSRDDVADRDGRPLVVVDLALPRDVDPAVADIAGVTLIDLETLRSSGAMVTDEEAEAAAVIVAAEVRSYLENQQALTVAPTVSALRARATQVIDAEMRRLDNRLPDLTPATRDEVANAVRRAVEKVLHAPTVRVKELASTPEGNAYAEALRELFGLDPAGPDSVTAVKKSAHGDGQ
jgi:glutamyl-tRNA reductase